MIFYLFIFLGKNMIFTVLSTFIDYLSDCNYLKQRLAKHILDIVVSIKFRYYQHQLSGKSKIVDHRLQATIVQKSKVPPDKVSSR